MRIKIIIGIIVICFLNINMVYSQIDVKNDIAQLNTVFIIGEHEVEYEALVSNTKDNLYEVCDNSMETAYHVWQDMLIQFTKYTEKENFDINGVKIWINVFWNTDGTIQHIVFYPKLNSKNIDFKTLTEQFSAFALSYQLPYKNSENFAHYGQVSFPVHPMRITDSE